MKEGESMSNLKALEDAGMLADFTAKVRSFLLNAKDEGTVKQILESVDQNGLQESPTMKLVGSLQRNRKIKAGLYKVLGQFKENLANANVTPSDAAPAATESNNPPAPSGDEGVPVTTTENNAPAMAAASAAPDTSADTVEVTGATLSEKEEEKIKERMKKEEEKIRQRLAKKEAKIRERIQQRLEGRAQRQGLKLEHAQKIKENTEKIKVLKEEMKQRKEAMKKLREEIKALKPKSNKKTLAEKLTDAKAAHEQALATLKSASTPEDQIAAGKQVEKTQAKVLRLEEKIKEKAEKDAEKAAS